MKSVFTLCHVAEAAAGLTLPASRNALPADLPEMFRLISEGKIRTDPWITHRLAFDEMPARFEFFTEPSPGTIKALVSM